MTTATANDTAMQTKAGETKEKAVLSTDELRAGMTVRVHLRVLEKNSKGQEKERIQIFEGMIIARRHRREIGSTITVRKISSGIGVERIFPLHSPIITKIEPIRQAKVRRAKLHYLRNYKKKLREKAIS